MTDEEKAVLIQDNLKYLDKIYEHTEYKIKYVKKYIEYWLYVMTNNIKVKNLNFIDCMCNAGIYNNGVLGTPIEVLLLFIEFSKTHQDKTFNLFLNDSDSNRINIIMKICELLNYKKYDNIKIFFSNKDVNCYLEELTNHSSFFESTSYNQFHGTILFVDPYCFGEVKINNLKKFTEKYYSELIFNYFNSDYRRNVDNISTPTKQQKIIDSMEHIQGFNKNMNEKQVEEIICKNIKSNHIKYTFSYPFRIKTNVELYHIIFATPSNKGLLKIKDSLWDIFNGDTFFKNNGNSNQMSFFDDSDYKQMNIQNFSKDAKEFLCKEFKNKTVDYQTISNYVLEHTMLKDSQIKKNILEPLIKQRIIVKNNTINKSNYKNDTYTFINIEK